MTSRVPSVSAVLGKYQGNTVGTWTVHIHQWLCVCVCVCVCVRVRWAMLKKMGVACSIRVLVHFVPVQICACVYEPQRNEKKVSLTLSLSLAVSLSASCSLAVSPSPLFIRTRRPGGNGAVMFLEQLKSFFVLGAEVPKAVNLEWQCGSGLSSWLSHETWNWLDVPSLQ